MTNPLPPNKGRFHFLIVSASSGESMVPIWVTCETQEEFLSKLYEELIKTRAGYCYLIVDGLRAQLHLPEQSFRIVLPDGTVTRAAGTGAAISQDGSFRVLEPV